MFVFALLQVLQLETWSDSRHSHVSMASEPGKVKVFCITEGRTIKHPLLQFLLSTVDILYWLVNVQILFIVVFIIITIATVLLFLLLLIYVRGYNSVISLQPTCFSWTAAHVFFFDCNMRVLLGMHVMLCDCNTRAPFDCNIHVPLCTHVFLFDCDTRASLWRKSLFIGKEVSLFIVSFFSLKLLHL